MYKLTNAQLVVSILERISINIFIAIIFIHKTISMKFIQKFSLFIFLLFFASLPLQSQSFKDKFFIALGYTAFLDYAVMPANYSLYEVQATGVNQLKGVFNSHNSGPLSVYTYGAKFRYNIAEMNENSSLSIHAFPALGISIGDNYDGSSANIGSLSIPLMLSFNTGNVATYKASKNKGFGIAAGIEFFHGGIISKKPTPVEHYYTDLQGNQQILIFTDEEKLSTLFVPAFELSYRYWNKSNKAYEFSLLFTLGSNSDLSPPSPFTSVEVNKSTETPLHIRLMWSKYLNY